MRMIHTRNLLLKNIILPAFLMICQVAIGQTNQMIKRPEMVQKLKSTKGLVAFWDFKEKEGHGRKANPDIYLIHRLFGQ